MAQRTALEKYLKIESGRFANERELEMSVLREFLATDRPLEFVRLIPSNVFNRISNASDHRWFFINSLLQMAGLDRNRAKQIRSRDEDVCGPILQRLQELLPQVREERKQAWLATQNAPTV
jgi:hypothetical protein